MSKNLEVLNNDDVISVISKYEGTFVSGNTLKPKQLLQEFKVYINQSNASSSSEEVLKQGIECEVLRHDSEHKGWRKGKIKFVVQFEPEETEPNHNSNSLDDIRQQLEDSK